MNTSIPHKVSIILYIPIRRNKSSSKSIQETLRISNNTGQTKMRYTAKMKNHVLGYSYRGNLDKSSDILNVSDLYIIDHI